MAHHYTINDGRATFAKLADLGVRKAQELAAGARKTAAEVTVAAQSIVAQAVAQCLSAGLGESMIRALYRDTVPASARKGVNLTQALACLVGVTKGTRTTGPHPDRAKLLVSWAAGKFPKGKSVSACYNTIRAARPVDYSKMLHVALAGLLAGGKFTTREVLKAVKAFLAGYENETRQSEPERIAAIQSERAQIVAEDTQEQEVEAVTV